MYIMLNLSQGYGSVDLSIAPVLHALRFQERFRSKAMKHRERREHSGLGTSFGNHRD